MPTKRKRRAVSAAKRLAQEGVRAQRADARKRSFEVRTERSRELRRKILIGTVILERIERGQLSQADLNRWLEPALTRAADRELLGLKAD